MRTETNLNRASRAEPEDKCSPNRARTTKPVVNVYRTSDAIHIEAELPGVDAASLGIDLENETMVISGKAGAPDTKGTNPCYAEWKTADFQRSFRLGSSVDRDHITADMKQGLLKLTLPLKEIEKPRKIQVNG